VLDVGTLEPVHSIFVGSRERRDERGDRNGKDAPRILCELLQNHPRLSGDPCADREIRFSGFNRLLGDPPSTGPAEGH
jgi:hypothetical protein